MVDEILKRAPERCPNARPTRLMPNFRRYGELWRCRLEGRCSSNDQVSFETEVPRLGKMEVFMCAQSPAFRKSRENDPGNCGHVGNKYQSEFPKSPLYECLCTGECGYGKAGIIKRGESKFCGASPAVLEENARSPGKTRQE